MKRKKFILVLSGLLLAGTLCAFAVYQNDKQCPTCNGTGSIIKTVTCVNCKGKGQVQSGSNWVPCASCNGNGKIKIEQCCGTCSGKGVVHDNNNGSGHNDVPGYPYKCE